MFDVGFGYETRVINASVRSLVVTGEIDMYVTPALENYVAQQFATGARRWIFDFTKVTFIDSIGLGFLLSCYKKLSQPTDRFCVVIQQSAVARVISLTRFTRFVTVFSDMEQAEAYANSDGVVG